MVAMVSSVKEALAYLQAKLESNDNEDESGGRQKRGSARRKGSSGQSWNFEELEKMLDIVRDQAEQVEGNIQLTLAGSQTFVPFDNHTLDMIPKRT
jgi:hypothetical protein